MCILRDAAVSHQQHENLSASMITAPQNTTAIIMLQHSRILYQATGGWDCACNGFLCTACLVLPLQSLQSRTSKPNCSPKKMKPDLSVWFTFTDNCYLLCTTHCDKWLLNTITNVLPFLSTSLGTIFNRRVATKVILLPIIRKCLKKKSTASQLI